MSARLSHAELQRLGRIFCSATGPTTNEDCRINQWIGAQIAAARSWPDAGDGISPSDTAVHLWAAGCDMETARFTAMMLERSGLVLAPAASPLPAAQGGR
jgi:hypothetical protein